MSDYDISHDPGPAMPYHGDHYESWTCIEPETTRAVSNLIGEGGSALAYQTLLLSIHGYPKAGSDGDVNWKPGDHAVYSDYVSLRSLEEYIRRSRFPIGRPQKEPSDILSFANRFMDKWGGWNSVDGVTLAYIPPVEE